MNSDYQGDLIPCPFCGSENVTIYGSTAIWAHCNNCGASSGLFDSREKTVQAWNRRNWSGKPVPQMQEEGSLQETVLPQN